MSKRYYQKPELKINNDTPQEQQRVRIIFENLRDKAKNKKKLLEREKEFLFRCLMNSHLSGDWNPEDFEILDDYVFKKLYLSYFAPTENGKVLKWKKGAILYEPNDEEFARDIKYLQKQEDQWTKKVESTRNKDEIIQLVANDVRSELKEIKRRQGFTYHRKSKQKLKFKKAKIVLFSKYVSIEVRKFFEENEQPIVSKFGNKDVYFDEFSMVHILNRHYAPSMKENEDKSYFDEDLWTTDLPHEIKIILDSIEKSNLTPINITNEISISYKNKDYSLWIKEASKSVKGKGNIKYYRINSFYPLTDKDRIKSLSTNSTKVKIDHNLSFYKEM